MLRIGAAFLVLTIIGGSMLGARLLPATSQKPGEVFIRIGDFSDPHLRASDFAKHYLPYALFALWAYDAADKNAAAEKKSRLDVLRVRDAAAGEQSFKEMVNSWTAGWEVLEEIDGPLPCSSKQRACSESSLTGLGYRVFSSQSRNEIVVAFRGTDFKNADDWLSNFRWVTRFLPYYDHYEQVQDHIQGVLDRAITDHKLPNPTIVSTGHSLGGGLAQQAAYKDKRIRAVYAFDASSVTGYYDRNVNGKENAKELKIDRVFQRGEVLAYLRFVMTRLYPVSSVNPQIRTVRFSFGSVGNAIDKHSMDDLAAGLLIEAAKDRNPPQPLPQSSENSEQRYWIYRLLDRIHGK